jgi:LPS O-antigen subunit length determinant protein (WzzB/FepE family)
LEKRQVDVGERLSHKFTMEEASVPEIKAWPKRSFVLILSVLVTFAGTCVVLLGLELARQSKTA